MSEQLINKLPMLLVDGNYFGHRCIHGLNKGGDFTLNTTGEMLLFEQALFDQMIGLYNSFNNDYHTLIGNMIFVFDSHSWRKDVEPHKPYYIDETEKYGYKENRQDSDDGINWDNWRMCLKNFQERIEMFLPLFCTEGAEGDDSLFMLTRFFNKNGIISIVFCTDGDLKQLIEKYVIIFRNTKSNDLPFGEIVINKELAKAYFQDLSPMDKLMGRGQLNTNDKDYLDLLFKVEINGGGVKSNAVRTLNSGISVPNFKADAFVKCITGDKKDNIFPIFRWKSNGVKAKNMKVTEAMIIKALKPHGVILNDDSLELMLSDTEDGKDLFLNLLLGLQHNTNQTGKSKNVTIHYKHNYRLNILSVENIPEAVQKQFQLRLKQNLPLINRVLERQTLLLNNKPRVEDGANILKTSVIEHSTTDNQTEILTSPEQEKINSEIDDILNS